MNSIPLTRMGLTSGAASNVNTIQGMNAQAVSQGLMLRWAAAYGDAGSPRYAAIWTANPGKVLWNADGVAESGAAYQARFNAQTSAWCRPAFVTPNAQHQYLSIFVDNEADGGWVARHDMSAADYQAAYDANTNAGFFPACVQAAGANGSAVFSALFLKSEATVAKSFTATGPVANAQIDAVIKQAMQDSPIRHASLAIVHGTKLVYARGYTLAEPSWPHVQPTTCFRLASVSKTVTALAIFQLVEAGKLKLSDTLQSILNLKTPSGGAPVDSRFAQVTIKHLLEHKSGLNPEAFRDGVAVRDAFIAAGHPTALPVSLAQTDAYVAGIGLITNPGAAQVYNNCGYHMLGRVVAKKWAVDKEIDACQAHLFAPLHITRIRSSRSQVSSQLADEARYRDPALDVLPSQVNNAQPPVPDEYGSEQIEMLEGGGGFSGAATDLGRLIAVLISTADTPALKRATLTPMLSAGAALTAAGMGRSGYGFDSLSDLGGGKFYGQKGGSLSSSGNVLQFSGDWGFAMQWGGLATAATNWYPDYPAVMNVAKAASWGAADLFPQFGMPSL
jgi:CubicO group peptidase (beta-lactamase class C family)